MAAGTVTRLSVRPRCEHTFVTYPDYIRQKAVRLRRDRKLTIDEIADRLAISRTTAYSWVGRIEIPRRPGSGFVSEAQRKGTLAMQAKYRRIRENAYAEGEREYPSLILEPGFRDFVCMYIGEGYKRSRNQVSLCNSDPCVVRLGQTWILRFAENPVRYSIQYHEDQDLDELTAFWSVHLEIRGADIRLQRKSNSGRLNGRNWRSRYGVLDVSACDTRFRARLQSWMNLIRAEWQ